MNGVAIDGLEIDLFLIEENRLSPDRAGCDDVPVGQYQPLFGIDDESGCLTRHVSFGVEGSRAVNPDRDDGVGDSLERRVPVAFLRGCRDRQQTQNERQQFLGIHEIHSKAWNPYDHGNLAMLPAMEPATRSALVA